MHTFFVQVTEIIKTTSELHKQLQIIWKSTFVKRFGMPKAKVELLKRLEEERIFGDSS